MFLCFCKANINILEPLSVYTKLHKERKLSKVILSSIHQLPIKQDRIKELLKNMEDVEFHFALEGISGKGRDFLLETIKEAKMFMKAQTIDSTKTTWSDLYKVMTKNKKR